MRESSGYCQSTIAFGSGGIIRHQPWHWGGPCGREFWHIVGHGRSSSDSITPPLADLAIEDFPSATFWPWRTQAARTRSKHSSKSGFSVVIREAVGCYLTRASAEQPTLFYFTRTDELYVARVLWTTIGCPATIPSHPNDAVVIDIDDGTPR
jgi:hypothetical protein